MMVARTPRELTARRIANQELSRLEVAGYPVDPAWIAAQNGLEILEFGGFPQGCYGALQQSGNRYHILVAKNCPTEGMRRFTIAHEVGHYLIEGHVDELPWTGDFALSFGSNFRVRDPIEVEADCFASELLLPERFVRPRVEAMPPGLAMIRAVAINFATSLSSAALRCTNFSPEPMIVALSHDRVIEWTAFSPHFESAGWARFRSPKGEWAPPASATQELARQRGAVLAGAAIDGGGLLCEWFEGAPGTLEVGEEALGMGSYGRVLTVLTCPDLPEPDVLSEDDDEESENDDRSWRTPLRGYAWD